jgi:hypothetical protein
MAMLLVCQVFLELLEVILMLFFWEPIECVLLHTLVTSAIEIAYWGTAADAKSSYRFKS